MKQNCVGTSHALIIKMKNKFLLIGLLLLLCKVASAQKKSEQQLIASYFAALQVQDFEAITSLYVSTDSLCEWVIHHTDKGSPSYYKMLALKNNEHEKANFDSTIKQEILGNLDSFYKKTKRLDIHWDKTVFVRYELEAIHLGHGLLIEKVTPSRYLGYLYFKDDDTRKSYVFTVHNLFQVNGNWYGGELGNIFEGQSKEDYEKAYQAEQKWLRDVAAGRIVEDSNQLQQTETSNDEHYQTLQRKEIAERRFYKGKFDNEINAQLYVRYIKGPCPDGVCGWDALFKFGDEDDYILMTVSKTSEGKWIFSEDLGSMELQLLNGVYTGEWAASDSKAEYDVVLKETNLSSKKAKLFDNAMDAPIREEEKQ